MPIDSGGNASDNRTDEQKKADDTYTKALAEATKDDPNQNITGYADPLKVVFGGKSLAEAGYNQELQSAFNAKKAADQLAKQTRPDGTIKDDDKPVKKADPTTTTTTEETSETTTEEQTDVDKAKDAMVAAANATANTATSATEAAAEPKKKGQKGGTIATSPQGISMDDNTGLRAFRGLLADETKKKKTLIA
tara:strand:- start:78 stop:656 length:579 start_codon:yes stop_codon:yes gene_type:complete